MSITLAAREARPASSLVLLTMSLGVLIAQIDTSVVNLAVKPIGTDLKASVTELQWIVDVYNFVYGVCFSQLEHSPICTDGVGSLGLGSRCSRWGRWCACWRPTSPPSLPAAP